MGVRADGAHRHFRRTKNLVCDRSKQQLLQVPPSVGSGDDPSRVHLPRQSRELVSRIAFGHNDVALNPKGLSLGRYPLQNAFSFRFHFADVEVGNGAGVERNRLAGRDDMDQGQGAAAGPSLGHSVRDQIVDILQIRRYQNLFRHHKGALAGNNFVEGFHWENLPAGKVSRHLMYVAVIAGTSACDAGHPPNRFSRC